MARELSWKIIVVFVMVFFYINADANEIYFGEIKTINNNKIVTSDNDMLVLSDVLIKDGFDISELLLNKIVGYQILSSNRYNEKLVYIFDERGSITDILLKDGNAAIYNMTESGFLTNFYKSERFARNNNIGGWGSGEFVFIKVDKLEHKLNQLKNKFAIITGNVSEVTSNNSGIFINFGNDHETDTTIGMWKRNVQKLNEAEINMLKDLQGKEITVRGMIESYNGPFIEISDLKNLVIN